MPSSIINEVWNAIKTKIAVDYSGGYSGVDLSDRVFQGWFQDAPLTPSAYIGFLDQDQQNGTVLTRYQGSIRYQIYCFHYGQNNFERVANAVDLGSDVQNALLEDRTLGLDPGRIDNIVCKTAALDGDKFGFSTIGVCVIEVLIQFQSDRGL